MALDENGRFYLFGPLSIPFRSLVFSFSVPCLFLFGPLSHPFRSLVKPFSVPCPTLFGPLCVPFPSLVKPFSIPCRSLFGPLSFPFRSLVNPFSVPCLFLFGPLSFPLRSLVGLDRLVRPLIGLVCPLSSLFRSFVGPCSVPCQSLFVLSVPCRRWVTFMSVCPKNKNGCPLSRKKTKPCSMLNQKAGACLHCFPALQKDTLYHGPQNKQCDERSMPLCATRALRDGDAIAMCLLDTNRKTCISGPLPCV